MKLYEDRDNPNDSVFILKHETGIIWPCSKAKSLVTISKISVKLHSVVYYFHFGCRMHEEFGVTSIARSYSMSALYMCIAAAAAPPPPPPPTTTTTTTTTATTTTALVGY